MTRQAFLKYMGALCDGESAKYACEEAVQELNNQLAAIRDPYEPVMPNRDSVTSSAKMKHTEGIGCGPGIVLAILLYVLIASVLNSGMGMGLNEAEKTAVPITLAICAVYFIWHTSTNEDHKKDYEKQKEALWQNAVSAHEARMAEHRRECARNEARRNSLRHMIEGYRTAQSQIERKLAQIYGAGIIPERFRNMIAVHQIREYVEMGVCSKLKGPDGAFAQYLQDLRAEKICNSITDMKKAMLHSLDRIAAYQGSLLSEMRITNNNLEDFRRTVGSSLERIESGMDGLSHTMSIIGTHTAETNAHARNIERSVRDLAYNNYIVQRYNNIHDYAVVHALRDPS